MCVDIRNVARGVDVRDDFDSCACDVCVCVRGVASSDDAMVRVMMNEWW